MLVHHLALASDWAAAVATGSYTVSTRGRTLAEEGFVHCARREQVAAVRAAFYADVEEPVVVLDVDTDLLTSPWRFDEVPGPGGEVASFPHVYGPIDVAAVTAVTPLLPLPAPAPRRSSGSSRTTAPRVPSR